MKFNTFFLIIFSAFMSISCSTVPKHESRKIASISDACKNSIMKFFSYNRNYKIDNFQEVVKGIKEWNTIDIPSLPNQPELFMFHVLSTAPPAVKQMFMNFPVDQKEQIFWMGELRHAQRSDIMERMFDVLTRKIQRKGFSFQSYFLDLEKQWKALSPADISSFDEKLAYLKKSALARQDYQKRYSVNLNLDDGQLVVGSARYNTKIENSKYLVHVPSKKIRSPAWNPLTREQSLHVNTDHRIKPPESYRVDLGLDGFFYLLDGNHRFHLKEKKEMVWVEMYELKTASFRNFLDLVGVVQPSESQIIELHDARIQLYDLLPKHVRSTLIWDEFQLID